MGVRRFHSAEEMQGPSPRPPLDSENLRLACGLSDMALHLSALRYEPGVRKFRSWDEVFRHKLIAQFGTLEGVMTQEELRRMRSAD